MKYIFSLCLCILLMMSCNNNTDNAKPADDTTATVKDNTAVKTDSAAVVISPVDLTVDEMKDDTVFADGSRPTSWTNAGIDDPIAFKKFLKHLQYWVANDQKDSVAAVIAFPLHNPKLKTKEGFLKNYDVYINDKVKKTLKEINFRQIFRRDQGAMIGNGEMWFAQVKNRFAVTAINN